MKIRQSLIAVALLAYAAAMAQEVPADNSAPPPARGAGGPMILTGPNSGTKRPVTPARPQPAAAPARPNMTGPMRRNITLHIQGTAFGGLPVDVEYGGSGPVFISNFVLKTISINNLDQPLLGQIQASLSEVEGGYSALINVGARIPTVTASIAGPSRSGRPGAPTSTITYYNNQSEATVLLKPGEPVVFLNSNGETLTATLTESSGPVERATISPSSLGKNLKLSVHVTNADGTTLDMSTVTDQPQVTLSPVVGEADAKGGTRMPLTASFTALLAPFPGGEYRIEYNLGQRLKVVTSSTSSPASPSGVTQTVVYQSTSQRGATFLKPGESATVFQSGPQEIILHLEKSASAELPQTTTP